jgi:hypothetical protein
MDERRKDSLKRTCTASTNIEPVQFVERLKYGHYQVGDTIRNDISHGPE